MQLVRRLFELFEDWNFYIRRDGPKAALSEIVSEAAKLPYRHLRFVILARSLLDPFPTLLPDSGLQIRPFVPGDLDFVRQIDRPSEARLCALRLDQGHRGWFALYGGRPAGYAWGSSDIQTRLERVHPHLDPGDVLCTDSYTSPAFRGKGIQTALTLARFHLFQELGCRRAICTIEAGNRASLAVWQRKLSSQPIGTIDFVRVGAWYKIRYQHLFSEIDLREPHSIAP